jgi:hypothetical protein
LENTKSTIGFDILSKEQSFKKYNYINNSYERSLKISKVELNNLIEKKRENNKAKMELLSQMLVFKPYYKKFLIFRQSTSPNNQFKISKYRKNLTVSVEGIESSFKFDYIYSLIDNPYEEIKYCNDMIYLNNEMISVFNNYTIQSNSSSDRQDLLALYISNPIKVVDEIVTFNTSIIDILDEVYKRLDNINDYHITVKLITSESFYEFLTITNENFKNIFEKAIQDNLCMFKEVIGFFFIIKNNTTGCQIKVIYMSYEDCTRLPQLLMKFNEINSTKKKRLNSTKKKRTAKDIGYILDESEFIETYYFASFIDIGQDDLSAENLKDLLYCLN